MANDNANSFGPSRGGGSSTATSTSLLRRMREGDVGAWQRLVDLYAPAIYHWCRQTGLGDADAGDVVQEVFKSVLTSLEGFDSERGRFGAWLRGITRHRIQDHFRRQGGGPAARGGTDAQRQLLEIAEIPDPSRPDSQTNPEAGVWHRAVELVRAEFEAVTWQAFWRVAVDGQRPADVAEELGMTLHAVYKAKSRVLRRVRQELAGLEDAADA